MKTLRFLIYKAEHAIFHVTGIQLPTLKRVWRQESRYIHTLLQSVHDVPFIDSNI